MCAEKISLKDRNPGQGMEGGVCCCTVLIKNVQLSLDACF